MTKNHNPLLVFVTLLALVFPILYLINYIEANIAFPVMFTLMGLQQLTKGLLSKQSQSPQNYFVISGIIFMAIGIGVVLPYYLFLA